MVYHETERSNRIFYIDDTKSKIHQTKRNADVQTTPKRSSQKTTVHSTPQSSSSTNTTRSVSTHGTTSAIRDNVQKLNMSDSESSEDKGTDKSTRLPIEEIPFWNIPALREYYISVKPDKRSRIMAADPSKLATMVLQEYPPRILKGLLSFFKARYYEVGLGGIEEHEDCNKSTIIQELLKAICKIKVYSVQVE
jgi:hypothetical protein